MSLGDENGRWVESNDALATMLGVEPAVLRGASAADYIHPDDFRGFLAAREQHRATSRPLRNFELRFIRADGEIRWAWISLTITPGPSRRNWILGVAMDVTDRKVAEIALLESREHLAAVADVARCVQFGEDPRPVVVSSIHRLAGAFTVSLFEAAGTDAVRVTAANEDRYMGHRISLLEPSATAHVWRTGERLFLSDIASHPMVNRRPAIESPTVVSVLLQPVVVMGQVQALVTVTWQRRIPDPGHPAVQVVQVIADEAGGSLQASRQRGELEASANTDPLTGSLNRRAWDAALEVLMDVAEISGDPLTIAVVDLDHFKAYNDRHGHVAGDAALTEFAAGARRRLRRDDVFARWGGEEFLVALPRCATPQASKILDRVRAGMPADLSCSIGHTEWIPGESLTACMSRADDALYAAKTGGRDRVSSR